MAAPPESTAAPSPTGGEEAKYGVEVCLFDESPDVFSRTVRAISVLTAGEPEPDFPDAEVERLASSITFLREWRHFSYEPKDVSFTCDARSTPSRVETHKLNLPQFSSASVPEITHLEDGKDNMDSSDFILFAGGNVWALDWCPRLCDDKPYSPINCEYLAVAAHPPGSSYHKIGMPLIGRGIIQVWCLLAPFEEAHLHQPMVSSNSSKQRGRPRKRTITPPDDHSEPHVKRPRGRPRKYPLPITKVEHSSENNKSQDFGIIDPCVSPTAVSCDSALGHGMHTVKSVEAIPKKGRGRPRKKPIEKKGSSSGHETKEDLSTALSPTALICMEPKKKRGRPRKYPAPCNNNHLPGADIELVKDSVSLPILVDCSLGPTASMGSDTDLTAVAVDAALQVPSSSSAICEKKSTQRARGHAEKEATHDAPCCSVIPCVDPQSTHSRETITNDLTVSVENSMPSEQSNIESMFSMHILPKSSNKSDLNGTRGRGRSRKKPLLSTTTSLFAPGTETPKLTNSVNLMVLTKRNDDNIARDLGSIGSSRCTIENNAHLSAVTSEAASSAQGLCVAKCKEESSAKRSRGRGRTKNPVSMECGSSTACNGEEQKTQTIPKSSDNAALVENCKTKSCPRKGRGQDKKESASNEISSLALGEVLKMKRSSTSITPSSHLTLIENSMPLGSSISEDMSIESGLIGDKGRTIVCDVMKMCESNKFCYPSDCNIENAQANQAVSVPLENSGQVIDELEDTEVAPLKESTKNGNMISCSEKTFSTIPKDMSLPRVVLCLAHNGKVAWDIKWKPPSANQSEQKTHLGFLAVLLGNGSLEVWEVPSPSMIQKIYSSSSNDGTDPRFLKLQPVFSCAKVKSGNRQSIPLTVDWSPYHDMILAGCHDGTVALWKFSTNLPFQGSKPFMCVTAESVPIRTVSWAPYVSDEKASIFVTAGEDGLKFWDLRDPYRPLWELTTAPRAVFSLQWLKDARGIVISLEDGTLKFLSLPKIANDVPATGRAFVGTKTQGVSTYQLSEHLIWSVHASEITGYAAYCVADGTAVYFELTPRFWEKEPGRNRVPYFLCGSLSEEGTTIKIGVTLPNSSLPNVPLGAKRTTKTCKDVDQSHVLEKGKLLTNSEYNGAINLDIRDSQQDGPDEGQETGAIVSAAPSMQENPGTSTSRVNESPENFEALPPKAVALHRVRWNMNKGSERWLCYGGASGIIRCQRI